MPYISEEDLGGFLVSAPAVASRWPNHLECFYRGKDNALWHRWWYGSAWSGERYLGGALTSAPAASPGEEIASIVSIGAKTASSAIAGGMAQVGVMKTA